MSEPYTLIGWAEFARNGKALSKRVALGERFAILRNGKVIARVEPVLGATKRETVLLETNGKG